MSGKQVHYAPCCWSFQGTLWLQAFKWPLICKVHFGNKQTLFMNPNKESHDLQTALELNDNACFQLQMELSWLFHNVPVWVIVTLTVNSSIILVTAVMHTCCSGVCHTLQQSCLITMTVQSRKINWSSSNTKDLDPMIFHDGEMKNPPCLRLLNHTSSTNNRLSILCSIQRTQR